MFAFFFRHCCRPVLVVHHGREERGEPAAAALRPRGAHRRGLVQGGAEGAAALQVLHGLWRAGGGQGGGAAEEDRRGGRRVEPH